MFFNSQTLKSVSTPFGGFLFNIKKMARKKSDHYYLTEKELAEFLVYVEKHTISQEFMAEVQGVSAGTVSNWLSSGKVLSALKKNVECRFENQKLKEKLKKVKDELE